MGIWAPFDEHLTGEEQALLESLDSPVAIQSYLDGTPYSPENRNRCPLNVIRDRVAHCLDGGLFAALGLRRLGYAPLVVDILPEPGRDDDHVLAIFRRHGGFGAVAKSNFVGLRYREPVYRTLRELVMSYFDSFFNVEGEKTLRAYARPLNLATLDRYDWMGSDAGADEVERRLWKMRSIPLITPEMAEALAPTDALTYRAGTLVTNRGRPVQAQMTGGMRRRPWLLHCSLLLCALLLLAGCEKPGEGRKAQTGYAVAQPVQEALEAHRQQTGSYPEALSALPAAALARATAEASQVEFSYRSLENGSSYELRFQYTGPGMNICTIRPGDAWACHGYY